jgi:hypothetical protein
MTKRLFTECTEILNAQVLSIKGSDKVTEVFKYIYPITEWGKIDWEKISNKIEIGYDQEKIIQYYDDVVCVGFETFDPHEGLIIEILNDGKISAGIVLTQKIIGIS